MYNPFFVNYLGDRSAFYELIPLSALVKSAGAIRALPFWGHVECHEGDAKDSKEIKLTMTFVFPRTAKILACSRLSVSGLRAWNRLQKNHFCRLPFSGVCTRKSVGWSLS